MSSPRIAHPVENPQPAEIAGSYPFVARDEGVTVRDFLLFLWRSRWIALIAGAACGVLAAAASLLLTPQYTATVVLLPVSDRGESMGLGSLGSTVSQLSGLASLAGLNLGGMGAVKAEALATLQSEVLSDQYIQQHNLMPVLFSKQWDSATRTWKTSDPEKTPTLWKAYQVFKKVRTVDDDTKTGLVKLTVKWKNPYVAAQWANGLVKLTNDYLRQRTIDEADRSIAYLDREVSTTNVVEVRSAIYGLMEAEIKKEMVARGREDFALRVIDPAVAPEQKSFPRPILFTVGGVLAGIFFGLLASVLRETMKEQGSGEGMGHGNVRGSVEGKAAALNSGLEQP